MKTPAVFVEHRFDRPLDQFMREESMRKAVVAEQTKTMNAALALLHGAVIERTPQAFGFLRNSLQWEVRFAPDAIIGAVQTPVPYARPVEEGSRPHWAPIGPLKLWAKRKLGNEGAAYAVQAVIAKRGTKGHHMFGKAWAVKRATVEKMFDDMLDRIVKRWGKSDV